MKNAKIVKIKKWYSNGTVETIKINKDGTITKAVITKKESK